MKSKVSSRGLVWGRSATNGSQITNPQSPTPIATRGSNL